MATVNRAPATCQVLADHLRYITPHRPANVTISSLIAGKTGSLQCITPAYVALLVMSELDLEFASFFLKPSALCNTLVFCLPGCWENVCTPFPRPPPHLAFSPWGPLRRGLVAKFQTAPSLAQEAMFPQWGQQLGGHPGVWLHLRSQSPRICRLPVPLLPARQPWCHVALDHRCSAPDPLSGRKCN